MVPHLWRHLHPDLLIFLDVDLETVQERRGGSWPGYVFTGDPLRLAAGHFGLGCGDGAHAPDEYYVIDSADPKFQGFDGAAQSFVDYLAELATVG